MKKYLVIVVTVLLVSPSFGQIPTGPDELGIYFDEAGTSVSITADGTSDINAYLILKNPSATESLAYWRVVVDPNSLNPLMYGRVWGFPRVGINGDNPLPGSQAQGFFVSTEGFEPQLFESIMVLADLYVDLENELRPFGLYLRYEMFYSEVAWDGPRVYFNPSTGDQDLPVAVINGLAPVRNTEQTWDGLKALYR